MDYETGKMFENLNAKIDFLIDKLLEAEKKAKGGKLKEEKDERSNI